MCCVGRPDVRQSEGVTKLVCGHQPEVSPPPALARPHHPLLLTVEVDVTAMEGIESVGQHPAGPVEGVHVAVIPGEEDNISTILGFRPIKTFNSL